MRRDTHRTRIGGRQKYIQYFSQKKRKERGHVHVLDIDGQNVELIQHSKDKVC